MKKVIAFLFIAIILCAMVFTAFFFITQKGVLAKGFSLYAEASQEPVLSGELGFNERNPLVDALKSTDKIDAVPPRYDYKLTMRVSYRPDITKSYGIYINPYTGEGCIEKGLFGKTYFEIPSETMDMIMSVENTYIKKGDEEEAIDTSLYENLSKSLEYIGGRPPLSDSLSEFIMTVESSVLGNIQYTLIADHEDLSMYANTTQGYYSIHEAVSKALYSTEIAYSAYKEAAAPLPGIKLLTATPIDYDNSEIRWTRIKPSGETEEDVILSPNRVENGTIEPGQTLAVDYSSSIKPDGVILYEYRDGVLFNEYDMLAGEAKVPKFEGSLVYTLKAIYEKSSNPESYGTISLDYSFNQNLPASAVMAYKEAMPGDILAFFIDYPDEGESFSLESNLGNFKADFMPYNDSLIVYMPINWWTSPKDYSATIYKKTDGAKEVFKEYIVTVLPDDFVTEYQYLEVSDELKEKTDPANTANDGVIVREAKSNPNPTSYVEGTFIMPLGGELGTSYAMTRYINGESPYRHSGLDIDGEMGDPIVACNNGVIVYAGPLVRPGNTLIIDHGMGLYTSYLHLSGFAVEAGDYVEKGDVVAYVGSTGFSTGPHLHWSVTLYGNYMSPLWLVENPIVPD